MQLQAAAAAADAPPTSSSARSSRVGSGVNGDDLSSDARPHLSLYIPPPPPSSTLQSILPLTASELLHASQHQLGVGLPFSTSFSPTPLPLNFQMNASASSTSAATGGGTLTRASRSRLPKSTTEPLRLSAEPMNGAIEATASSGSFPRPPSAVLSREICSATYNPRLEQSSCEQPLHVFSSIQYAGDNYQNFGAGVGRQNQSTTPGTLPRSLSSRQHQQQSHGGLPPPLPPPRCSEQLCMPLAPAVPNVYTSLLPPVYPSEARGPTLPLESSTSISLPPLPPGALPYASSPQSQPQSQAKRPLVEYIY